MPIEPEDKLFLRSKQIVKEKTDKNITDFGDREWRLVKIYENKLKNTIDEKFQSPDRINLIVNKAKNVRKN